MKQIFAVILLSVSFIILFFSCAREENEIVTDPSNAITKNPKKDSTVTVDNKRIETAHLKLYVENTFSMVGHIKGFPQFKEVLARLINEVEFIDSPHFSTHVYLINSTITELNIPSRITIDLNKDVAFGKGDRGNSDFEKVISKILDEHHNDDDISVLAADFIYSPTFLSVSGNFPNPNKKKLRNTL